LLKSKFYLYRFFFLYACVFHHSLEYLIPPMRSRKFCRYTKSYSDIALDIRYYSPHNFVGEKVDGYLAPKCFLTKEAAEALSHVQKDLEPYSLSLKIYDCYRPQRRLIILSAGQQKLKIPKQKKNSIRLWIKEIC